MINTIEKIPITGIYKITSPSNRIYIGQFTNIQRRFNEYKLLQCVGQPMLYRSLKKYGYENHIFETIEECSFEKLNEQERYWQDKYEVLSKGGLNLVLTQTNSKSGKHSDYTINKMKEYWAEYYKHNSGRNKGIKQSKETCDKKIKVSNHPSCISI